MITINNIDKVTKQVLDYTLNIRNVVSNQIILIGNETVNNLQLKFPDLTITGQFFANNIEYWIIISKLGEELTWIKCPVSNLGFTRRRDEFGSQEFKSDLPELNVDELVQQIASQLSLQINQIVGVK